MGCLLSDGVNGEVWSVVRNNTLILSGILPALAHVCGTFKQMHLTIWK